MKKNFVAVFVICFDSSTLQHIDSEAVEIGVNSPANRPARSNPMQTPAIGMGRNVVPVLIESGSASMYISQFVFQFSFAISLD